MLTCDITVPVMKIFLILTGQNVAVHLVTCDSGLVSEMVLVAEDRGLVGASDLGLSPSSWRLDEPPLLEEGVTPHDGAHVPGQVPPARRACQILGGVQTVSVDHEVPVAQIDLRGLAAVL